MLSISTIVPRGMFKLECKVENNQKIENNIKGYCILYYKMENSFVDILGFEGSYQINRLGVVKTISAERGGRYYGTIKKATVYPRGYVGHKLYKDKQYHSRFLHRLLAEAFIPNPENKPTIDHIDRNPSNNKLSNLRWATHTEQHQNMTTTLQFATPEERQQYVNKRQNDWRIRNRRYLAGAQELRDIAL